MTNEAKAQEIINKHWEWLADFLERNNLSKEDRNQIRFKTYEQCLEMAELKDEQHKQELIRIYNFIRPYLDTKELSDNDLKQIIGLC